MSSDQNVAGPILYEFIDKPLIQPCHLQNTPHLVKYFFQRHLLESFVDFAAIFVLSLRCVKFSFLDRDPNLRKIKSRQGTNQKSIEIEEELPYHYRDILLLMEGIHDKNSSKTGNMSLTFDPG